MLVSTMVSGALLGAISLVIGMVTAALTLIPKQRAVLDCHPVSRGHALVLLQAATGPVLLVVDSSTLERDGERHWRRVAASYAYFGLLGVLLWRASGPSTDGQSQVRVDGPSDAVLL